MAPVGERTTPFESPRSLGAPARPSEAPLALFEANVPAFEDAAHLDRLPAKGFVVAALPMKIRGGTGGPLRIVA